MKAKALFVSHLEEKCGVGQFGRHIAKTLVDAKDGDVEWQAIICDNPSTFIQICHMFNPDVIVYNYYPSTMPWYYKGIVEKPSVGIVHETAWLLPEFPPSGIFDAFDYLIHPDGTLPYFKTPVPLFRTPRLIYEWETQPSPFDIPTFGSFGFGFLDKNFDELVGLVQSEYDEAIIRLHIPSAKFGDPQGSLANAQAERSRAALRKMGIMLEINHEFLSTHGLLKWLADNWMNCFIYAENYGRGLSSTIDYALSVDRPIAVNNSYQFRHLDTDPSIRIGDLSLHEIMENGVKPLLPLKEEYSAENFVKCYNDIIKTILED